MHYTGLAAVFPRIAQMLVAFWRVGRGGGVRHGFFRDDVWAEAPTYLLDFDVYRQGIQAFDIEEIKEATDVFNELALQLFQQSVTEKMLAYWEGDDV